MLTSETILHHRYHLQQQLGNSPARQTWLARDLDAQIPVVVKLLALGGAVQWDELKLFEREAQILEQLNHPRIPKYYDYFSLDDQKLWFGLVQRYIPGQSLKQKLERSKALSQAQVRQVAEDVLEILQYLHALNPPVLHRDIKPSNLLWGDDDRVYLLDFGAVQVRPPAAGATFTVVGTYGYTPLEQYGGQAVPASDLYALGASLIHLLTGVAPSELSQNPDDFRLQFRDRLGPGADSQFVAWLEKLTEPSPQKRFSSAKEAREALDPQPSSPTVAQHSRRRIASIRKTSEQLIIEIPSRFEIEFLKPWQDRLDRVASGIGRFFRHLSDRFERLERQKKHKIVGAGAIAAVGLVAAAGLMEGLVSTVARLILWPFGVLLPLLPLIVLIWVVLGLSRGDYYERTRVCFNAKTFEIQRKSSRRKKREGGEIARIEEIYLTKWRDRGGKSYHSLAIATQIERKILFFASTRNQQHLFGQQLSELELHWLAREIQDWLNAVRETVNSNQ